MDISQLSSNWKQLQANLPKGSKTPKSNVGKRKNDVVENSYAFRAATTNPPKKRKLIEGYRAESHASPEIEPIYHKVRASAPSNKQTQRTMGILSSRPAHTITLDEAEVRRNNGLGSELLTVPSNAIEDIPSSQRILVERKSSFDFGTRSQDAINSGLAEGVKVGKYIALDCEMVGVGPEPDERSMLARVSVVNFLGEQVYDSFVAPKETVTDYRTAVSGITPQLLRSARSFEDVQRDVAGLLKGRVLVGHAIRNDLEALMLGHPKRDIRDTSRHKAYREISAGRTPALKRLARELLGVDIQGGAHSSIEDARVTMLLYKREKDAFESQYMKHCRTDGQRVLSQPAGEEINEPLANPNRKLPRSGDKKKRKKKRKR